MLNVATSFILFLPSSIRRRLSRGWYQYLARRFDAPDWVFMNYGFAPVTPSAQPRHLEPEDEQDRFCIQLYDHLLADADLRGLDVLEVGCGRGGGASFIARYRRPRTMTGVDLSEANIAFCRRRHAVPNLRFLPGNAEALPFADASYDVVVNVESSHNYHSMPQFLAETRRVLRPGGAFYFADLRGKNRVATLRRELEASGLIPLREENITGNVLHALQLDGQRKLALIRRFLPWVWHGVFRAFAAIPGTPVYEAIRARDVEYLCFAFWKDPLPA